MQTVESILSISPSKNLHSSIPRLRRPEPKKLFLPATRCNLFCVSGSRCIYYRYDVVMICYRLDEITSLYKVRTYTLY